MREGKGKGREEERTMTTTRIAIVEEARMKKKMQGNATQQADTRAFWFRFV
jgi:hypothetical protein